MQQPQRCNAMQEELATLKSQHTWNLVALIKNQTILGCKWMFKIKLHSKGAISHHKARLVAQSYRKQEGIEYFETFNLITKIASVSIFLMIITYLCWKIKQLDISNAFLHGKLSENIYMFQPPGFIDLNYSS